MALTTEEQALRRKIIDRNRGADAGLFNQLLDELLDGGEKCREHLQIWAAIFEDEEIKSIEKEAQNLLDLAAAKRAQLLVENNV